MKTGTTLAIIRKQVKQLQKEWHLNERIQRRTESIKRQQELATLLGIT